MDELTKAQVESLLEGASQWGTVWEVKEEWGAIEVNSTYATGSKLIPMRTMRIARVSYNNGSEDAGIVLANARLIAQSPSLAQQLLTALDRITELETRLKAYETFVVFVNVSPEDGASSSC